VTRTDLYNGEPAALAPFRSPASSLYWDALGRLGFLRPTCEACQLADFAAFGFLALLFGFDARRSYLQAEAVAEFVFAKLQNGP